MVEIVNTTVCSVSHARAYARTDRSFIVFTVTSVTQPPKLLYFKILREQVSDFNKQKGSQLLFFSLYDSKKTTFLGLYARVGARAKRCMHIEEKHQTSLSQPLSCFRIAKYCWSNH